MRTKTGSSQLAARVKKLREVRDLSQEKLSELAGISMALLQKIEYGERFGRKDTHEKLAKALGVTVAYLVYGDEEESDESDPLRFIEDEGLKAWFSANIDNLSPAAKRHIAAIIRDEAEQMRNQNSK